MRHLFGTGPRTGRTGLFSPCPADKRPEHAGGSQEMRIKFAKSLTVLTAMALGAGTAMAGTTAATAAPAKPCVTDKNLVPSCGVLWGAAAGGFTTAPRDAELKKWEKTSGRTASIFPHLPQG
ncbi:hypothetical protein ACFQFC_06200 [Amorphoplanes digitatis]|uniref:hypothetical protein n=1 Tax=Actinoplanes digitatis TaxID=1868 RepID=UPI003608E42F